MHSLDKQGYNLQISKFIHFGNSLVQLTNAIDLAKKTKSLLMLPNIGTCNEAYEFLSRLPNFSYTDGVGCNETLESKFYFKDEKNIKGKHWFHRHGRKGADYHSTFDWERSLGN